MASNEFRPVVGLARRRGSMHSTHCYERSSVSNAIRERPRQNRLFDVFEEILSPLAYKELLAAWWLAEVADVRVRRQTRRPVDLHAEELPHLIPVPERPYDVAEVVYRTVDAEGFVSSGQNGYSVPWHYIGQVLTVRITEDAVTVSASLRERVLEDVKTLKLPLSAETLDAALAHAEQ